MEELPAVHQVAQTFHNQQVRQSDLGDTAVLIGWNRSPYVRRVGITVHHHGIPFEQRPITAPSRRSPESSGALLRLEIN